MFLMLIRFVWKPFMHPNPISSTSPNSMQQIYKHKLLLILKLLQIIINKNSPNQFTNNTCLNNQHSLHIFHFKQLSSFVHIFAIYQLLVYRLSLLFHKYLISSLFFITIFIKNIHHSIRLSILTHRYRCQFNHHGNLITLNKLKNDTNKNLHRFFNIEFLIIYSIHLFINPYLYFIWRNKKMVQEI